MTETVRCDGSRRTVVIDSLLLRREKHTPVQAVVCQVGTKEGGQGVTRSGDLRKLETGREEEVGQDGLPRRKERRAGSLLIMAVGVLRLRVWWTSPPQPRILHRTYNPSYSTLRRCQEAIGLPLLRVGIMQDWRAGAVRRFDGKCLSPLRQGEIAVIALLRGNHALTNLVGIEPFCIRADDHHISPQ